MGLFSKITNAGLNSDSAQSGSSTKTAEDFFNEALQNQKKYRESNCSDMKARAKAKQGFEQAGQLGLGNAYEELANFYLEGEPDEDLAKVNECFIKGAQLGSVGATIKLAVDYIDGWGIEKNEEKAIALLTELSEKGCIHALWFLGDTYNMEELESYDPFKSFMYMLRLAHMNALNAEDDDDVMSARYRVGKAYIKGEVVKEDELEGMKWIALSAAQGYWAALDYIGAEYHMGTFFPRRPDLAKKYYLEALDSAPESAREWKAVCCRSISELVSEYDYLVEGQKNADFWLQKSQMFEKAAAHN